jgi:hypothetical protein
MRRKRQGHTIDLHEEEAARAYDRVARVQHSKKKKQRFRMQLNFLAKKGQAAEEAKQLKWIACWEAGSQYRGVCCDKGRNKWVA